MVNGKRRRITVTATLALLLGASTVGQSQEPGWTSRALKWGVEKQISDETPILLRPYRPLHFYGNMVRRYYYRGNPLPSPRDLNDAAHAFFYFR
ncbi:MAG TPA: hypothetical protein EYQ75_06295 [Planctomycetaceae bacterium]|nr:hypothetical protein [Planctomycetaceae bacterium]